ncbi:MAG: hypothetical protein U9N43_09440 [Euryarchaeota archaeon]|nr:hypothetical protein [Euryarchaeota archaeon]
MLAKRGINLCMRMLANMRCTYPFSIVCIRFNRALVDSGCTLIPIKLAKIVAAIDSPVKL